MIVFQFKNKEFTLHWNYSSKIDITLKKTHNTIAYKGNLIRVSSTILRSEDFHVVSNVDCNVDDQFVKETGRKLSIKKLEELISPELFNAVETAYENRKK